MRLSYANGAWAGELPGACVLPEKPVLIYDGDCGFCKYWVRRWQRHIGDAVEWGPSQELGPRFPAIAPEAFARSVQFVETDGTVYSGAEAVWRLCQYRPGLRWTLPVYRSVPGVRAVTEFGYRTIADHRTAAGWLTNLLWGKTFEPPEFFIGRWLFLRSLGLVFLVAFLSLQPQIVGLIGGYGILPAQEFLDAVESQVGGERFWRLPTLYWFTEASDGSLIEMCALGLLLGLFAALGVAAPFMLFFAAAAYLSLITIGRDFMSFQWDILLIETAFLAVFYAPLQAVPRISSERAPSRAVRWLLWLLLFKLMFMSGFVKLDDRTWTQLRALEHHYETQPLPTVIGWYAHQLPAWFQAASVVIMFVIELGVPFLIFAPRRARHLGAMLLIALQLLIAATGNYTFFNWLAISLCLLLFDDQFYRGLMPKRLREWIAPGEFKEPIARPVRYAYNALFCVMLLLSATVMFAALGARVPDTATDAYRKVAPFRIVSSYGLFAHMTTSRPEIVVEGSDDGETWKPYRFRWKPGDLTEPPRWAAPHQPRLDWQMWFAALGSARTTPWFSNFAGRLLQGARSVEGLLESNPFPKKPPRYLRAIRYEYRFTDLETRRETGQWWERTPVDMYFGPVELPEGYVYVGDN